MLRGRHTEEITLFKMRSKASSYREWCASCRASSNDDMVLCDVHRVAVQLIQNDESQLISSDSHRCDHRTFGVCCTNNNSSNINNNKLYERKPLAKDVQFVQNSLQSESTAVKYILDNDQQSHLSFIGKIVQLVLNSSAAKSLFEGSSENQPI